MKNTFRVRRISATVLGIDQKYLALGLAFAICLLLVAGMKAASAVGPTQSPPSGNVTPNFTSITVNNTSTFKAGLDLQGPLKNNVGAETPVSIGDNLQVDGNSELKGNVNVTGNLDAKGTIKNSGSASPAYNYSFVLTPITANSCKLSVKNKNAVIVQEQVVTDSNGDGTEKVKMTVLGDELSTTVSFPACTANPTSRTIDPSDVNVVDDVRVSGNLEVIGDIVGLVMPAQSNIFDTLTVNNTLNLKGKVTNPNASTVTLGVITVSTPPIELQGDLKLTSPGNLDANGAIINTKTKISGDDLPVAVKDSMALTGTLLMSDFGIQTDSTVGGSTLYLQKTSGNAEVGSASNAANLKVYGDLDANNFFGHQLKKSSCTSLYVIFGGGTGTTSASCGTGEYLLSCGYKTYTGSVVNKCLTPTGSFSPTEVYPDYTTSTCYVKANKSPSFKGIKAHAICTTKILE